MWTRVLWLLLFVGCVEQPEMADQPQKIVTQNNCQDDQKQNRMVASNTNEFTCENLHNYRCDIREFTPHSADQVKKNRIFCQAGTCLYYDHFIFSTASAIENDQHATEADFEYGSQYHYREVNCWGKDIRVSSLNHSGDDLSQVSAELIQICIKEGGVI